MTVRLPGNRQERCERGWLGFAHESARIIPGSPHTPTPVRHLKLAHIQPGKNIQEQPDRMINGQPFPRINRQQAPLIQIHTLQIFSGHTQRIPDQRPTTKPATPSNRAHSATASDKHRSRNGDRAVTSEKTGYPVYVGLLRVNTVFRMANSFVEHSADGVESSYGFLSPHSISEPPSAQIRSG